MTAATTDSTADATRDEQIVGIAVELYALLPAAFTAARDARAAAESDPALAAEITALRKPVVAAWVVDEFARSASDELAGALGLAAELREAQAELDAPALAVLNRQRRTLVRALARRAADLADARGVPVSTAVLDAVEKTLNAAMRDEGAAAAVASGRLVRPLEATGLDPVDVASAVGGPWGGSAVVAAAAPPADELAERRRRKQQEREARDARRAADVAERERSRAEGAWQRARERAVLIQERAEQLEAEAARVRREAEAALAEVEALGRAHTAAVDRAKTAARESARLPAPPDEA